MRWFMRGDDLLSDVAVLNTAILLATAQYSAAYEHSSPKDGDSTIISKRLTHCTIAETTSEKLILGDMGASTCYRHI